MKFLEPNNKMTNTERESLKSGFKDFFALNEAKSTPLIESLKHTITEIYLPQGYKARFWEDWCSDEFHIRIEDYFNHFVEYSVSINILEYQMNSGFIKRGNKMYRMFPMIEEAIKEMISKINFDIKKEVKKKNE